MCPAPSAAHLIDAYLQDANANVNFGKKWNIMHVIKFLYGYGRI